MKYSHSSRHRKNCPHDPDTRAQLGFRLRYARLKLGWSIPEAGKYFQVTERTWHNWETGTHRIPFAVYKLARVLARLELPGAAWAGWRLEGSSLITPEGRQITPQDGSWWSLLVRQAAGFRAVYDEASRLRLLLGQSGKSAEGAGLVPSKTSGNGDTKGSSQDDVIMPPWPILSDSLTPLTLLHVPGPIPSASASTPCSVSPWTPTCGIQWTRPPASPHRPLSAHLKQGKQPPNRASSKASRPATPLGSPGQSDGSTPANNVPHANSARLAAAQAAKLASASGDAA